MGERDLSTKDHFVGLDTGWPIHDTWKQQLIKIRSARCPFDVTQSDENATEKYMMEEGKASQYVVGHMIV